MLFRMVRRCGDADLWPVLRVGAGTARRRRMEARAADLRRARPGQGTPVFTPAPPRAAGRKAHCHPRSKSGLGLSPQALWAYPFRPPPAGGAGLKTGAPTPPPLYDPARPPMSRLLAPPAHPDGAGRCPGDRSRPRGRLHRPRHRFVQELTSTKWLSGSAPAPAR